MNDEKFSLFPVCRDLTSEILAVRDAPLTMTSEEIADLAGVRHDNVKRAANMLAGRGIIGFPQIEEIQTATKPRAVFVFSGPKGKRDSIVVLAQVSPEFTGALVDRWMHLEDEVKRLHDAEVAKQLPRLIQREMSSLSSAIDLLNKPKGGKSFPQKAKAVHEILEKLRRSCTKPGGDSDLDVRVNRGLIDLGVMREDGTLKPQVFLTKLSEVMRLYVLECAEG